MSQRGATLVIGLMLLALVTMLALAGASAAHIESRLAQAERFRENADSAASAGIEWALRRIVTATDPAAVPPSLGETLAPNERFDVTLRFAGLELALPQASGSRLAGAHFEIVSTGTAARRSVVRHRATAMWVVASDDATPLPCEPPATPCLRAGDLVRTGWQRLPLP
jgi:Tfp pilus assembly protein PilX